MPPKSANAASVTPTTHINTLTLIAKGEIKKARVSLPESGKLTLDAIHEYMKKKSAPVELGSYIHETTKIYLFGYKEGRAGTENKHELPPPYADLLAFGDIIVVASSIASTWETPAHFTEPQWETFYEAAMGGFEDVTKGGATGKGSADSDDEEEAGIATDEEEEIDDAVDDAGEDGDSVVEEPLLVEEEEEEKPALKAASKKKKASAALATGYQQQMVLMAMATFKELTADATWADNPTRTKVYTTLEFIKELGFTDEDRVALEDSIYMASFVEADRRKVVYHWDNPLYRDIYMMLFRNIIWNIHPSSIIKNPTLIHRIHSGEVKLTDLPTMTALEVYPENWQDLVERQSLREQKLLEGNKGLATDRFKCSRCHKKECTYYEMQTRSADEPMTIFITCLNCNKRWRQ